jgi:DNA polymerase-3 subunit delta'
MTLAGHTEQGQALRDAFAAGRMHHAWLLAGPRGVGKASFARAAAAWVLARAANGGTADDSFELDYDHPTARLLAAGSHLDFRLVEILENPKTGKMRPGISVDQFVKADSTIGEPLASIFRTKPALSDWRVIVVDAADDLNRNAANAFLKNLEEPPPNTLFLAVSHSPSRLLPTIRSRCRVLRFQPLADPEVETVIGRLLPGLPEGERAALVTAAEGSPGRAMQLASANIAGLIADLDALASAPTAMAAGKALAVARSLSSKAATPRYEAFLGLVPAYIASASRERTGARLARALALWEKANTLAASALGLSLDPQSVAFELAELVAGLATPSRNPLEAHEVA